MTSIVHLTKVSSIDIEHMTKRCPVPLHIGVNNFV